MNFELCRTVGSFAAPIEDVGWPMRKDDQSWRRGEIVSLPLDDAKFFSRLPLLVVIACFWPWPITN